MPFDSHMIVKKNKETIPSISQTSNSKKTISPTFQHFLLQRLSSTFQILKTCLCEGSRVWDAATCMSESVTNEQTNRQTNRQTDKRTK